MATRLDQATKDFYLRSYLTRGHDHVPDWVNVSTMLRLGANPNAQYVSDNHLGGHHVFQWTSVEHCYEILKAQPTNIRLKRIFEGYLRQFRKYGFIQ